MDNPDDIFYGKRLRHVQSADCHAVAKSIEESCRIIGVDLDPKTQLGNAVKGLLWFGDSDKPALDTEMPESDRSSAMESFLRFEQMSRLSAELERVRELPGVAKFRKVLRSGIDSFENRSSPALDLLAELSVAARLEHSSDFSLVRFEEPDVTAIFSGDRIGFAVKRIHSSQQVKKRIREARRQIEDAGLAGVIAIDVEPLLCYDRSLKLNVVWESESLEQLGDALSAKVGAFVEGILSRASQAIGSSESVLGLVVYSQATGLILRANSGRDSALTWARSSRRIPLLNPSATTDPLVLDAVAGALRHE